MNARIVTLLAVFALAVVGCTNDAPTARPRLLAEDEARIGDLNGLDTQHVSLNQQGGFVNLEFTSCRQAADAHASTPRLVIGEPVCVFSSSRAMLRID